MKTRVILADDHALVRDGLRSLIEMESDMEVVGQAATGREAVRLAGRVAVQVVVMDVCMPDLNGIEATRRILASSPSVKVVAMSGFASKEFVREMLTAGAAGYVPKRRAYEELARAIREVMHGGKYLSPEVAQGVVDEYVELSSASGRNPAFVVLTDREREVLQELAEGRSTKEIADDLSVSGKTVETHRRNIMEKLKLHSIAALTKYAVREGLTSLET